MHHETADLLVRFDLVRCSAESAFDRKITDAFFPHGLGHLLGLQTHDVGGKLANAEGNEVESPERFPSLRYTREIDVDHVFTVEPGLYFIPMLLDALRESEAGADVNWNKVDALRPCGGIRIEDNVVVTSDGADNLTRPAFRRDRSTRDALAGAPDSRGALRPHASRWRNPRAGQAVAGTVGSPVSYDWPPTTASASSCG